MSRIKRKTLSLSPITSNLSLVSGFTFIEMIVAISILGIVALIGTGFLLTSLSSSGKAEINKEVRQNGNFALSVIEGLIVSAKSVSCTDSTHIVVTDVRGNDATISCDTTGNKIASSSASENIDLTAINVAVTNCNFTCTTTVGNPTTVGVGFSVSQVGSSGRPSEKSSASFQTQVSARNY